MFIAFEGGEGVGKTTQVKRLHQTLVLWNTPVRMVREPGSSPFGEEVRRIVLGGRAEGLGPGAEAILFSAARMAMLIEIIPFLKAGGTVISDRFYDSTRAYQGTAGATPDLIDALEWEAASICKPDLTIVLDMDPRFAFQRIEGRQADRFEKVGLEYHRKVRDAFLGIVRVNPFRCVRIDASYPPDDVEKEILAVVMARMEKTK